MERKWEKKRKHENTGEWKQNIRGKLGRKRRTEKEPSLGKNNISRHIKGKLALKERNGMDSDPGRWLMYLNYQEKIRNYVRGGGKKCEAWGGKGCGYLFWLSLFIV